jgi:hypothetical protein
MHKQYLAPESKFLDYDAKKIQKNCKKWQVKQSNNIAKL